MDIGAKDIEGITKFAVENNIDFAVVAPDDPLVLGAVDALKAAGIKTFGPDKKAAIIEGSKAFSKELMKKYNIPTAAYEIFSDMDKALEYVKTCPVPVVVKADGLALGKGVIIAETRQAAEDAVKTIMGDKIFRRQRQSGCHRRIPDRAGSVRTVLYRWQDHSTYDLIHGSQESPGRRQGPQYRRYGNSSS